MSNLIYILGAGRSGTTLLDIILGNSDDIFSAGELNRFPVRNGIPPKRKEGDPEFDFWYDVRSEMLDKIDIKDYDELDEIATKFEHHTSFFKAPSNKEEEIYTTYLNTFFDYLFKQIEEDYVVDSSKYPKRAYQILKKTSILRGCIYIKRHPVSVVQSFQKEGLEQPSQPWYKANLYLMVVGTLSFWVLRKLRKKNIPTVVISYEELTTNPIRTLEKIEKRLKVNLAGSKEKIAGNHPLKTGKLFDGNRIRLQDSVILRENPSSEKKWPFYGFFVYVCNLFWWKLLN